MNNKYKILLIEDEVNIRTMIATLLDSAGYSPIEAATCAAGKTMAMSHMPDLIILDLGLPDEDGLEFLKWLRQAVLTPVIVLSARSDEADKVEALDLGANDYITKPFSTAEFMARVRSIIRFNRHSADAGRLSGGVFQTRDLEIHYDSRQVFMAGVEVKLTQTEYNILAYLTEYCGKVMTYSTISRTIWGYHDSGCIKKLQVNMANIRKKLGITPGDNHYIINELGVGYRMNAE